MKFKVRTGIVEIETKDPYMRSFLVAGDGGNTRINVYRNDRNFFFRVVVKEPRENQRTLSNAFREKDVKDYLAKRAKMRVK